MTLKASRLDRKLPVTEIFRSLEGEGLQTGIATVFVRVWGCPVKCKFCDTKDSWKGKEPKLAMTVHEVLEKVWDVSHRPDNRKEADSIRLANRVSITGGEPLLYPEQLTTLVQELQVRGYRVNLESSGTILNTKLIGIFDTASLDIKTPCSGVVLPTNTIRSLHAGYKLAKNIQFKAVIKDKKDLKWLEENFAVVLNNKDETKNRLVLTPCWPVSNMHMADALKRVNKVVRMIEDWNQDFYVQTIVQQHKIFQFP